MNARQGRKMILFVLVPAGNSGPKGALLDRMARPAHEAKGTIGVATHNLFDEAHDPIQRRCTERGLVNAPGSRIKVIHVPIYLGVNDGLLELPYEAVLRAMEVSCFPSFYEPWGYTPEESLAVACPRSRPTAPGSDSGRSRRISVPSAASSSSSAKLRDASRTASTR
jgi:phosphorylase/glycogen(starch) synthase